MAILIGEGATAEFAEVSMGELVSIDGPAFSVASVARTVLASDTKKYRPSFQPDPGQVTCVCYMTKDNYDDLLDVVGVVADLEINVNDDEGAGTHKLTIESFITDLSLSGIEEDSNVQVTATFQTTELPAYEFTATGSGG